MHSTCSSQKFDDLTIALEFKPKKNGLYQTLPYPEKINRSPNDLKIIHHGSHRTSLNLIPPSKLSAPEGTLILVNLPAAPRKFRANISFEDSNYHRNFETNIPPQMFSSHFQSPGFNWIDMVTWSHISCLVKWTQIHSHLMPFGNRFYRTPDFHASKTRQKLDHHLTVQHLYNAKCR